MAIESFKPHGASITTLVPVSGVWQPAPLPGDQVSHCAADGSDFEFTPIPPRFDLIGNHFAEHKAG